jgi:predicted secreted hydrolase
MRFAPTALLLIPLFAAAPPPGSGYRQAAPGYHFEFPRDHFNHPDYATEWWYYTGNLRRADGHRYGFELVFFRQGADSAARSAVPNPSAWRVDDYYMAHLALTDIDGKRFHYVQRVNRAGPGIAGVSLEKGRIWNGNWQSQWDLATSTQTLSAVAEGIRLQLRLAPAKPPVIHGENGISAKAWEPGHASHYVSFTRLEVSGTVNGGAVTGTAWMDHEWFTNLLDKAERGWDWFSVQRDDGSELMLFEVRRDDGRQPFSAGTYVDPEGRSTYLRPGDFTLQPLATWTSPKTGARYPIRWRIAIPRMKLTFECTAAVADQELVEGPQGNSYWEGAATYEGGIRGAGYLEMTGYAKPVSMGAGK